jgi:hypothetical protein
MIPALYLAQAAAPAIAADVPPDLLAAGAGSLLGGGGLVGALGLLARWVVGAVESRLTAADTRITALEGVVGDLRRDLAVAAERDRGLRALLEQAIRAATEASR